MTLMKKILNIKKKKNKSDFNLDKILLNNNLNYSEMRFEKEDIDVLKSYKTINNKLFDKPNYLTQIKNIIPLLDFNAFLKPLYTIAITSIVIFAGIKFTSLIKPVEYAEIIVDKGEKITLHINKNITVWLNSNSSIKIPLELNRNSTIYLDGEAYFEVTKKNIAIISKGITFKCKNSKFHINTNKENELIAHVTTGNLELYNPKLLKSTKINLTKNDKLTYKPCVEFITYTKDKDPNYLAWKTGVLKFENTRLNNVSETISAYYQIPITIKNYKLKNKTFSATFKNAEIDDILDKIQTTFNCKISGDGSKLIIN